MLKTAVIIGGLPRNYKETSSYFWKMVDSQKVDVYIFTWDLFIDEGGSFEHLKEIYKPVGIEVGNYNEFSEQIKERIDFFETLPYTRTGGFNLQTGLMTQHYTIKKAFELISNPNRYDLIVRYRFDWFPLFKLNYTDLFMDSGPIYYPINKTNGLRPDPRFCINDMFAVGNPKSMKVYCSLFDRMLSDAYLYEVAKTQCFIPEYILAVHLRREGILTEGYNFPYMFKNRVYGDNFNGKNTNI